VNLCWLIPTDRSGGVATVALSCCRQAVKASHSVTLLSYRPWNGWISNIPTVNLASLDVLENDSDGPSILLNWLGSHPMDFLFLNGCSEVIPAIDYLSPALKCVLVIHDTAPWLWSPAV
jgi:hypothetical protein